MHDTDPRAHYSPVRALSGAPCLVSTTILPLDIELPVSPSPLFALTIPPRVSPFFYTTNSSHAGVIFSKTKTLSSILTTTALLASN